MMNVPPTMRRGYMFRGQYDDGHGSTARVRMVLVEHTLPDGTTELRPTMKPRDRSRYMPRRNTPKAARR